MCLQLFGCIFWIQLKTTVLITFELQPVLAWVYYFGKVVCLTSKSRLSLILKQAIAEMPFPFTDINLDRRFCENYSRQVQRSLDKLKMGGHQDAMIQHLPV